MSNHPNRSKVSHTQALERAVRALHKARDDTDHFRNGDMASHEIVDIIRHALRAEFGGDGERAEYARQVSGLKI